VACRRTSRGCGTTRQGIVHAVSSRPLVQSQGPVVIPSWWRALLR
jgi:hypothetical protein